MNSFPFKLSPFSLLLIFLSACENYPRDPNSTLSTIKNEREIFIGLINNPPFVKYNSVDTAGIEVQLMREFAERLKSKPLWTTGSEGVLMEKLKQDELHLIIGGIKSNTPYKSTTGLTRPYYRNYVMVIQQGENEFLIELEKFLASRKTEINKYFLTHDR